MDDPTVHYTHEVTPTDNWTDIDPEFFEPSVKILVRELRHILPIRRHECVGFVESGVVSR